MAAEFVRVGRSPEALDEIYLRLTENTTRFKFVAVSKASANIKYTILLENLNVKNSGSLLHYFNNSGESVVYEGQQVAAFSNALLQGTGASFVNQNANPGGGSHPGLGETGVLSGTFDSTARYYTVTWFVPFQNADYYPSISLEDSNLPAAINGDPVNPTVWAIANITTTGFDVQFKNNLNNASTYIRKFSASAIFNSKLSGNLTHVFNDDTNTHTETNGSGAIFDIANPGADNTKKVLSLVGNAIDSSGKWTLTCPANVSSIGITQDMIDYGHKYYNVIWNVPFQNTEYELKIIIEQNMSASGLNSGYSGIAGIIKRTDGFYVSFQRNTPITQAEFEGPGSISQYYRQWELTAGSYPTGYVREFSAIAVISSPGISKLVGGTNNSMYGSTDVEINPTYTYAVDNNLFSGTNYEYSSSSRFFKVIASYLQTGNSAVSCKTGHGYIDNLLCLGNTPLVVHHPNIPNTIIKSFPNSTFGNDYFQFSKDSVNVNLSFKIDQSVFGINATNAVGTPGVSKTSVEGPFDSGVAYIVTGSNNGQAVGIRILNSKTVELEDSVGGIPEDWNDLVITCTYGNFTMSGNSIVYTLNVNSAPAGYKDIQTYVKGDSTYTQPPYQQWKPPQSAYIKSGGSWNPVVNVWIKTNGSWKPYLNDESEKVEIDSLFYVVKEKSNWINILTNHIAKVALINNQSDLNYNNIEFSVKVVALN